MPKYALVENKTIAFFPKNPSATTKRIHGECGTDLQPREDGYWFCPECLKFGFLLKSSSD